MVKSMTGYGRAVETVNGREFTVELRSVNNRYLDCTVKLPRMLSFAEDAVKQAVKASISRGKVDVYISVHAEGASDVKVTLNAPMVEGYLAAMKQMVADYGVQDDISVSLISRMPEVFSVEKPEVDEEQLLKDFFAAGVKVQMIRESSSGTELMLTNTTPLTYIIRQDGKNQQRVAPHTSILVKASKGKRSIQFEVLNMWCGANSHPIVDVKF